MKSHPTVALRRSTHRGFTLLELLVVMVIIGILAALTVGAFQYAQASAARNRTVGAHSAIAAALEQYKEKFGEFPEPSNPNEEDIFVGSTMRIGGAHMLYQAITADGSSAIALQAAGDVSESDGQVSDIEHENLITSSPLPKSIIAPFNVPAGVSRPRYLVDGWNRPFQYTKANTANPAQNTAVNPTYDLWSYGPMKGGAPLSDSVEIKNDPIATAQWIKNW